MATGKLAYNLSGSTGSQQTPTTCVRWRPPIFNKSKQILLSVNIDGSILHWNAETGK